MPGVRAIVNRLSMPFNVDVAHQDRRVVETQLPKRTDLRMGEKLIPGGQPNHRLSAAAAGVDRGGVRQTARKRLTSHRPAA